AGDEAIREWAVVMRAMRAYREDFVAPPRQYYRFIIDATHEHRAIRKPRKRNTVFQIRFRSVLCVCHEILPAKSMHEIRCAQCTYCKSAAPPSPHAASAGLRPNQGRAASSWAPRRISVVSSPKRPTNCTASGRPPLL